MKIVTDQSFRMRNEDYIYCLIFIFPFIFSVIIFFIYGGGITTYWIFLVLNITTLLLSFFLIRSSYLKRLKESCFLKDGRILKYLNDQLIFDIPLEKIVSVRVQDRKGSSGSIIFFTNEESLDYWHTYIPMNMHFPPAIYGLTQHKINLIEDRKWLIKEIMKINPKLHFIESY